MAYPGDGYKMSNYGLKKYSPEQTKEQWRENVDRENKITEYHAASKKANECSPIDTLSTEKINYFNNAKSYEHVSTYDHTFHIQEGYSSKLKRDDRQHTQGLNVHAEEVQKQVPVLTSSVYGHRDPLEHPDRKHVRIGLVKREFYRSCGTNMTPTSA